MQNLSPARVGRDTEEMYPHGQLAAAPAAGPCTSTALSISTPVGMWWVHIVQWAALITMAHNSPMSGQRKRQYEITRVTETQTQRLTFKFSWLCMKELKVPQVKRTLSHCLSFLFSCWGKIPWLKTIKNNFPNGFNSVHHPRLQPTNSGEPQQQKLGAGPTVSHPPLPHSPGTESKEWSQLAPSFRNHTPHSQSGSPHLNTSRELPPGHVPRLS